MTAPVFLTARWTHLLMLNYEIDPAVLAPYVPAGTTLDTWQGRALVSMVGFHFLDTRVRGFAIPFHRHFDEVNLRFYVRRETPDEVRRGVVFIKEIVPKRAIAWVARTLYNENYVALPMRHDDTLPEGRDLAYQWQYDGSWYVLGGKTKGDAYLADEDAEEAFITEHYWGYARQRDGGTMEYQVEHPRWKVWQVADPVFEEDVTALYGPAFAEALSAQPTSAFVADGSAVSVRQGQRLRL